MKFHELIHVLQSKHVAIKRHDPVILCERQAGHLAPAVIEAWVVAVVSRGLGFHITNALLGNLAQIQGIVPFFWKALGVQG